MTPEVLKNALAAEGFKIAPNHLRDSSVGWYAWRQLRDCPDCALNDKPPSLIVYPYHINHADRDWYSVEFDLSGQLPTGEWLNAKVYSITMDEAIAKIPNAERILVTVWNAAATPSCRSMAGDQKQDEQESPAVLLVEDQPGGGG
jgi:hypothetical protein